jgi:hypothetical protein
MATQPSDVAINYANQVINMVKQLQGLRASLADLLVVNTNNPLGNQWNVLNTTALTSDGQVGTADTPGTPVNGHYIDPRLYPAIGRLVKNTDLANGLSLLVSLNSFLAGTQINAAGTTPAFIDALAM